MKGKVVMRFVGNRQEPEPDPVQRTWGEELMFIHSPEGLVKFLQEEHDRCIRAYSLAYGLSPKVLDEAYRNSVKS